MRKITVHFKSTTGKGTYTTYRARTGERFCTCPGFMFRRTCRHVIRAKEYAK